MFEELNQKISESKHKNLEEFIEDKMKERSMTVNLKSKTDIGQIVEDVEDKQLSLRKNEREKEHEKKRRLTNIIKDNKSSSIYTQTELTSDILDYCQKLVPNVDDISKYINFLNSQENKDIYYGLLSIRILTCIGIFSRSK